MSDGRTYREDLYRARRINLTSNRLSLGTGFRHLMEVMQGEGIVETVKKKREWIRPGQIKNLERMASRKRRFDNLVKKTIADINDLTLRLRK